MKKFIRYALFTSAFFSVHAHAFLIECKGLNDEVKQARFIQQIDSLPIVARIQTINEGIGLGATLKMQNASIVFKGPLPKSLQWTNDNKDIDLVISEERFRENPNIRPFGYKSKLTFRGSGYAFIDNEDFICRYFQM